MNRRAAILVLLSLMAGSGVLYAGGLKRPQLQDTIKLAGIAPVEAVDTSLIGPESLLSDTLSPVNENQLPPFASVLGSFYIPHKGKVISRYGIRRGRMHTGTDIKLNRGDTVYAAYYGEVKRASAYYGYGNLVVLSHSHGLETYYAHLSSILVRPGDFISPGEALGLGGRTGRATTDHLHFEIRENGKAYNPELVYDFENAVIRTEIAGKEALAELIRNPKTGEEISITTPRGNSYAVEMSAGQMAEYVIKAGDSLWEIARRFNTSVAALCEHNNLTSRSVLRIGTVLKIFGTSHR